jgi:hypothetical protein
VRIIATPDTVIEVRRSRGTPRGIDWDLLPGVRAVSSARPPRPNSAAAEAAAKGC